MREIIENNNRRKAVKIYSNDNTIYKTILLINYYGDFTAADVTKKTSSFKTMKAARKWAAKQLN